MQKTVAIMSRLDKFQLYATTAKLSYQAILVVFLDQETNTLIVEYSAITKRRLTYFEVKQCKFL